MHNSPTRNVPIGAFKPNRLRSEVTLDDAVEPNTPVADQPDWKTEPLWLHWDLNPCMYTLVAELFKSKYPVY